ncbi:glycosyltransferase [Sandaracinus amylolyticus]|uniref:Putative glycosyl transferase n=1 Tax=Sandaracinus amylolyticus TaxID=927083 RepID=A0A0F6W4K0_9BACT|nr:glycosyltransferase [Sandaracinus amylolyticus]AKF07261.1 putative glycosyl transferase [Sandaracinus amylolyticus]
MIVVLPCFNEEKRLDPHAVAQLVADPRIDVILVDDGSTDGTRALLESIAARHPDRVTALSMGRNVGKAEAVRTGVNLALERIVRGEARDDLVGYLDADFATPPEELSRMLDRIEDSPAKVAMGSRIARLGARVRRKQTRHYLGRLFATTASMVLDMSIYDTQCGAKLFRDTPALRAAMSVPFRSRWVFDVELLGRLTTGTADAPGLAVDDFLEIPLEVWEDVRGSKLGVKGALRGGMDLLRLGARVKSAGRGEFFPKK